MPVPDPRNKILPARGNISTLQTNVSSLDEGEICYALDEDQYYQKEGGVLVSVGATKAQGILADSALQSADNISELTNDAGYVDSAGAASSAPVQSVAGKTGSVSLVKGDVGLGNVDNTSDANKPVSTATQAILNVKADLVGGVIPDSQIPAIAVTDYLGAVANQTAMLALTGQKGDWCIRSDDGAVYVITGSSPSQLSSWTALSYPEGAVTSVAGRTGAVTLSTSDIAGLGTAAVTASTDYATAAQGTLADSAIQPGDNVSELTNDSYTPRTSTTGSAQLPSGTELQRDASPAAGYIRFNTDVTQFEGYTGSNWSSVGGGATGGGSDTWAVEHDNTITTSYTIGTGKNVISAGTLTINSGATITVPSGSTWVIA